MTQIHTLSQPPLHAPQPLTPPPILTQTTIQTTTQTTLDIRTKLLHLESLSINSLKALTVNPNLHTTPLSSILTIEQTLISSFGLPRTSIGRIFDMFPNLLSSEPSSLHSISDFLLNDVVLPFPHLSRAVTRCPRILVSDVDSQLRPTLRFLRRELRLHVTAHTTVLLVSSVDHTLTRKIEFLKKLGFTDKVVINMVQRAPSILTYSVESNLSPKIEYFLNDMKGNLSEIKRFPQFFSFSLDSRIKLRHKLLEECGVSMSLKDMLKPTDAEFAEQLRNSERVHLLVLSTVQCQTIIRWRSV
ncbi:transcription termination factor MTEF1, chloroplastic-like isoform X2 [Silene latifolia]|uniref:transcription termination factor MTEF1, chloroplastic-like isoform X2 n=1 Tax=Silene latifolia TaxID=37657 RepID=UPI003D77BCC0